MVAFFSVFEGSIEGVSSYTVRDAHFVWLIAHYIDAAEYSCVFSYKCLIMCAESFTMPTNLEVALL